MSGTSTPCVSRSSARYFVTWSATARTRASTRRRTTRPRRRGCCSVMPVLPRHTTTAAAPWAAAVVGSATELCLAAVGGASGDVAASLDVGEQRLQVALQTGAVVTLEDAQLVDLALEERALLLQLGQRAVVGVLGLPDDPVGLGAGLVEDPLTLLLAVVDVLVVHALGEGEHAGRGGRLVGGLGGRLGCRLRSGRREGLGLRLGLGGRLRRGGDGGGLLPVAQLGDPALGRGQL